MKIQAQKSILIFLVVTLSAGIFTACKKEQTSKPVENVITSYEESMVETKFEDLDKPTINPDDKLENIIEFIKQNRIYNGCFYDFDRNGTPELVEILEGDYFCSYYLYTLDGEIIGELSADTVTDTSNMLTLYYDSNSDEYFYFGETYIIYNGTDIGDKFYLWVYKINDSQIESECVGEYTGIWDGEKYWYKDISFMGNKVEDGYYNKEEINTLLGINEYLSRFEKIEEVNLDSLWNYDSVKDETYKEIVENKLKIYLRDYEIKENE